jgi:hypothetical protein
VNRPGSGSRDLQSAAVSYAAAGWPVFPLSRSKAPLFPSPHDPGHGCRGECGQTGHGFHDATTDPATVSAWWTQHPTALIGARVPRGLLVLDIDIRGRGDVTLSLLEQDNGPLPRTLICFSGRGDGGRHLYLQRPSGPLTGVKLRPGIDLIHHGLRYTILPPSPHPKTGMPYWWENTSVTPAPLPARWVTLLSPPPPAPVVYRTAPGCASVAGLVSYVLRQKVGGRHETVLWALCTAIKSGATDGQIDAICQTAEHIGKPRGEIDSMRLWAQRRYGRRHE